MKSRLYALDDFVNRFSALWRPQPFKEIRPDWCAQFPELGEALLGLSDADVVLLEQDNHALLLFLSRFIPELERLADLCGLPKPDRPVESLDEVRFGWEVPGRKRRQIEAFCSSIDDRHLPLLEWCGGKGHLGRTLGKLWQQSVDTVEWNSDLCKEGRRLSERAVVEQEFYEEDALEKSTARHTHDRHVVALHACGELHRRLIQIVQTENIRAMDFSPCCYHLGQYDHYIAFNDNLLLNLSRDDLRLSVTNSDTASTAQVALRNKEMAWKLGFDCLRRHMEPSAPYKNIRPIIKPWLKLDFAGFAQKLANREGLIVPAQSNWSLFEQQGWKRQNDVMRLNLVRFAFRRAIEIWLVLDMAVYLQDKGYDVHVSEFCSKSITPRNILISAHL